jgi:hypothetical protein
MVQGVIAQLVERLHGMQEVGGSIPPGSTSLRQLDGSCAQSRRFAKSASYAEPFDFHRHIKLCVLHPE